jgi:CubicO group peptidase (beta-lactamase class C family)
MKPATLILMLALVLGACTPAATPAPTPLPPTNTPIPTATPVPAVDNSALRAKADQLLQNVTKAKTFSGAVLLAQNGQVILSQGYGFADREKEIPNTPQTQFRIGQITWGFTAMAILILQEQGKLNVQDKLCTYVADCPDQWKPVTLHHLLTNTSGIPLSWPPDNQPADKVITATKSKALESQPGEKFNWGLTGYLLLGKTIEAASGQTYEAFLQKNIFDPLQMTNTGYDHGQADLAIGYADSGTYAADLYAPEVLFAAGALYSTVEDLYRWEKALSTDKLVPQKSVAAMFAPYIDIPNMPGWSEGYSVSVRPTGPSMTEETGLINGYTACIHRYPDDQTVFIVLTNQENSFAWNTADLITQSLFGK